MAREPVLSRQSLKNRRMKIWMVSGSQVFNGTDFQKVQKRALIQTNLLVNLSAVRQESSRIALDR